MFPSPHLSTVILCGLAILQAGTDAQKDELLPQIAAGKLIMALAMTEPEASWNGNAWMPEGITLSASAQGDGFVLSGSKMFVHDANIAGYLLCAARTRASANPEDGITLFLVDAKSPGISLKPLATTAGDKQFEVVFDNVKAPRKSIIGQVNRGWPVLSDVLQKGSLLLCASMVGASQKLLELTVDYAKTRVQFEQPIGINQYVQEHCVNLLTEVDSSWWMTYYAAWKVSQGQCAAMDIAMAKAWVSDAHERACWYAHQVHGGVGYTIEDGVLPLFSRRGKSMQLYLGDARHHMELIARELEKMPAPPQPLGKPLALWEGTEEQRIPDWFERFSRGAGMQKESK